MKEKDATLLYDTLQELLMALTDGFNTTPFVQGSAKARAVDDALAVMLLAAKRMKNGGSIKKHITITLTPLELEALSSASKCGAGEGELFYDEVDTGYGGLKSAKAWRRAQTKLDREYPSKTALPQGAK